MLLLDLFCGEGGAAMGYFRAGFRTIIGVDSNANALKRYPFDGYGGDWAQGLAAFGDQADLIHASPPCQRYSAAVRNDRKESHPDLIEPVREALRATGKPYVIENVPCAPLIDPAELCGCMFGLGAEYMGKRFAIYRPRLLEANFPLMCPVHSWHKDTALPVLGHGCPSWFYRKWGYGIPSAVRSKAMGTDWMSRNGTSEAVPPIFTEFVGMQARVRIQALAGLPEL